MKKITILIISLTIIFLSSCATSRKQLTREEWLVMTSHTFKNTTVNDVLITAEKVLRLSDSDKDVKIYHLPNKMVGTRYYFIYAVLAAASGHYNFDVTAVQKGPDVEAQLLIGNTEQAIMPMMTQTPGVQGGWHGAGATVTTSPVAIGTPEDHPELYRLFFSRMESLFYKKDWLTCEKVREDIYEKGGSTSVYSALCLNADDNKPISSK